MAAYIFDGGFTMLSYERHLVVILAIAVILLLAAVVAVVLDVPLPF